MLSLDIKNNFFNTTKGTMHHYELGHVAFRQLCMKDPYLLFEIMFSNQRQKLLKDMWQLICEHCDGEGEAKFSIQDLKVVTSTITTNNFPLILLIMPPPLHSPEAYFVAIILKVTPNEFKSKKISPEISYFTLEKGKAFDCQDRTVLCAWDMKGCHFNYGDGPEPTTEKFLEIIGNMI